MLASRSSSRERRPSRMRSRTSGLGAGEEGEADVEVVVVPGVGAAGRDEVLEVLLAVGRQLVGDARPLCQRRPAPGLVDPAGVDQLA